MKLEEVQDSIIEMRNNGYGYKRIAKSLNANPTSVKRWIVKLGLPSKLDMYHSQPRTIQCEECGKSVSVLRHTARFCSDACRVRVRKIRAKGRRKCARCNASIFGLQNVSYCSDDCKHKHSLSSRKIRLVRITCIRCNKTKLARYKRIYCSDECGKEKERERYRERSASRPKHNARCIECSKFFQTTRNKAKYCSVICRNRFSNRKTDAIRRRKVSANGRVDWTISIERLTKRDGRTCYLCNELMDYQAHSNHDNYPSIEHVQPISKGGTHTWDNVKLAHRKCNYEKADTWGK